MSALLPLDGATYSRLYCPCLDDTRLYSSMAEDAAPAFNSEWWPGFLPDVGQGFVISEDFELIYYHARISQSVRTPKPPLELHALFVNSAFRSLCLVPDQNMPSLHHWSAHL